MLESIYKIDGRPNVAAAAAHSSRGGPGVSAPIRGRAERYDCVIVGAGASGLAAAKFYQDRFGPDKTVLLLDPLPDFGGHSHRNEFHVPNAAAGGADLMLLRNGGTVNLDSIGAWNQPAGGLLDIPGSYGQPALDMLEFCGVDPGQLPELVRARHPRLLRAAPDAAVPGGRVGHRTRSPRTASTRPSRTRSPAGRRS